MKYAVALLFVSLFFSCSMPTECEKDDVSAIPGLWTGYEITTEDMLFQTKAGVRGIDIECHVAFYIGSWFVWNGGYVDIIESWSYK